jgi:uncharacterized protein with NRDE domain
VCILLAITRPNDGDELWVAANRDESLTRPWERPQLLVHEPPVFGGRDLVGGGSWLAVNLRAGFVVGVTNAGRGAPPAERSRGRLVLDLAREKTLPDALALLSELDLLRYGEFNLLLGDPRNWWVATNAPAPRIEAATGSVVAIGNDSLVAPAERVVAAGERARFLAGLPAPQLARSLQELLADHEGADPLCRHGEGYGTVCSTILTLRTGEIMRYLFAPGPPCTTPFEALVPPTSAGSEA